MSCNFVLTTMAAALQAAYGKSVLFATQGDRLHLDYNTTLCDYGTGDYTIEFFFNLLGNTITADQTIWSMGVDTATQYTPYWRIYYNNGRIIVEEADTARVRWQLVSSTFTPGPNQWFHVALVRRSNYIYLYIDGVMRTSGPYSAAHISGMQMDIGVLFYKGGYITPFQGLISNLRLTKYAVYTADFTRPAQDLMAYPETVLLTCQSSSGIVDNSSYHWPISGVGTVKPDSRTPFA